MDDQADEEEAGIEDEDDNNEEVDGLANPTRGRS